MLRCIFFLCLFCLDIHHLAFSVDLEADIRTDLQKFSGQKNRAILLLQDYTANLNSPVFKGSKENLARKIAAILGEGKGVGGFKKTRKAKDAEKIVMVQALDAAYQYYALQDIDFFATPSTDAAIKKHQAILWGLSKAMGIRATQRMHDQEQANIRRQETIKAWEDTDYKTSRLEGLQGSLLVLEGARRAFTARISGTFASAKAQYVNLVPSSIDNRTLKSRVRSLITNARLSGYDKALEVSSNLMDLLESRSSFARQFPTRDGPTLILNTKRWGNYWGSIFNVVSIYQYNSIPGRSTIVLRRNGFPGDKLDPAIKAEIAGLAHVDFDIVIQKSFFDGEAGPYRLRPHGKVHPDADPGYDNQLNVQAKIFESNGVTLEACDKYTGVPGLYTVCTHEGVASPDNLELSLPARLLAPDELYSFISVVKEEDRGVVTLHGFHGEREEDLDSDQDIVALASFIKGRITAGDLFLLMHYCPLFSKNPHFLKLLVQWLG